MVSQKPKKEIIWYSGEVQYEGYPLHLRFPEKPDFKELRKRFPTLLTITHEFEKVKTSGEPENEYNESLADFDHDVIISFEKISSGKTVLIETFGGRRSYYIYVSIVANINHMRIHFSEKYKRHKLTWEQQPDPTWRFIRRYAEDYKFY